MSLRQGIFLTGATGLLGRYLLRDLLAAEQPVAVLVRDSSAQRASDRLAQLVAFGEESLGRKLLRPTLLVGDMNHPGLGLDRSAQRWLGRHVRTVIHSAAYVAYHPTPDGQPWETNVNGTRRLLELWRALGLSEVHHISTAFVCGDRRGLVYEDELDQGGGSENAYEQSKFAAEQMIRGFDDIRATIYRPSSIIGDSRTGYTSTYHHFYRFLELAVRLSSARPGTAGRRQRLPVRLPLSGEETQNLVPVDWVSQALLELVRRPQWHGRTYHLAARQGARLQVIKSMVEELLHIEGIQWAGRDGLTDPTALEQMVLEQFRDYWSYLHNDLQFDCRNTRQALPDLPPPELDRELMVRLLRFAQEDDWGRDRKRGPAKPPSEMAHYLEGVLPEQVRRSTVARALPRGLLFGLDIHGPGGGRWTCRCGEGAISVQRGLAAGTTLTYRLDASTFEAVIRGRKTAQAAFFDGQIEIAGDTERALMLAALIEQLLRERPYCPGQEGQAKHALAGC